MSQGVAPITRYEVKAVCPPHVHLAEIRSWIELHPEGFAPSYLPRQVNSIYLDTDELACMEDNLDGTAERTKLRYRWYGPGHRAVRGVLELKYKSNRLGWKEYRDVPVPFDLTTISWYDWMCELQAHATGPFAEWLARSSHPTLINSYVREYYESPDELIRVTIDHDLVYYDQLAYSQPNLSYSTLADDRVVIEIKADSHLHRRVSQVLAGFPIRPDRFSKYVQGLLSAWTAGSPRP